MILGLPTISFFMLIGIPAVILAIMLYDSWRILTGRKK